MRNTDANSSIRLFVETLPFNLTSLELLIFLPDGLLILQPLALWAIYLLIMFMLKPVEH